LSLAVFFIAAHEPVMAHMQIDHQGNTGQNISHLYE